MGERIKLTELDDRLAELSYPVPRERAVERLSDTTLQLADGETGLGDTVAYSETDGFQSAADLAAEVRALLPREAVGEPFQSEGEG